MAAVTLLIKSTFFTSRTADLAMFLMRLGGVVELSVVILVKARDIAVR